MLPVFTGGAQACDVYASMLAHKCISGDYYTFNASRYICDVNWK